MSSFNPVPLEEILEGDAYFIAHPGMPDEYFTLTAGAHSAEDLRRYAVRGLVHRTKEEAQHHGHAMWDFTCY